MMRLSPPSSKFQASAMCRIPAGSGFGGRKLRVTIGAKVLPGRNVWRRCITEPLNILHQPYTSSSSSLVHSPPCPPFPSVNRFLHGCRGNACWIRDEWSFTQNFVYTIPSSLPFPLDTLSAPPIPAAPLAAELPRIRFPEWLSEPRPPLAGGASGCGRGCLSFWGFVEPLWTVD